MSLNPSRALRRNPERLVPSDNLEVYRMLYAIENGLRELIIEELSQVSGPRWYKSRLPGDLLKKYKEGLDIQKLTKWTNLVPHHPIYYLDFPDLRKIIERDDNWRDAFQRLFSRKDIVGTALSEIESIRNATAHNRRVSENDRTLVESAFNKLVNCVGNERLEAIVLTTLTGGILQDSLESVKTEAEVALALCRRCKPLVARTAWQGVKNSWWFDDTYLDQDLIPIDSCFVSFDRYDALPRRRGEGHLLEKWIRTEDIEGRVTSALTTLTLLLRNR